MVVEGGIGTALVEVPFEPSPGCLMQGNETALAKLGIPDDQTIGGDVLIAQMDRF